MFVVQTIPQLEEAVRENAREVMIIGPLSHKVLEVETQSAVSATRDSTTNILIKLSENYRVSALHDSYKKVTAVVLVCETIPAQVSLTAGHPGR